MNAPLRKGWCPGALRPMQAKDGLLVRLRITGGILPAATAHAVADLAERHGNGLFDLSARANLQMRGVRAEALPALHDALAMLGLIDASADAEAVRNVIASPLAGLHDGPDIRPIVAALEARLAATPELHALPGKFGFLVDDGSWPTLAGVAADVRFDWDGGAFVVGLGGTRANAVVVGRCPGTEVAARAERLARRMLQLFVQHPEARRLRDLVATLGPTQTVEVCAAPPSPACGRRWPDEVGSDEGSCSPGFAGRRSSDPPHPTSADAEAFCKRQKETAPQNIVGVHTFGLGLAAPFGRLTETMLHAAADLAAVEASGNLRLTPWRLVFVPGLDSATDIHGFITDPADPRLSVTACVGEAGCARGSTDTRADAAELASLAARLGGDLPLHVSGCEKGCAKPSPSPVTLVARGGCYDLVQNGVASDSPLRRGLDLADVRAALAAMPV